MIEWGKRCYHCGSEDHTRDKCDKFNKMMKEHNGDKPKKDWRPPPGYKSAIAKARDAAKAADKSKSLVDDFVMLQRFRVQKVMLVCSDYDSYTFEEEGCVIATVTRCSVPGQQPASVARVACDGGVPPGCA